MSKTMSSYGGESTSKRFSDASAGLVAESQSTKTIKTADAKLKEETFATVRLIRDFACCGVSSLYIRTYDMEIIRV